MAGHLRLGSRFSRVEWCPERATDVPRACQGKEASRRVPFGSEPEAQPQGRRHVGHNSRLHPTLRGRQLLCRIDRGPPRPRECAQQRPRLQIHLSTKTRATGLLGELRLARESDRTRAAAQAVESQQEEGSDRWGRRKTEARQQAALIAGRHLRLRRRNSPGHPRALTFAEHWTMENWANATLRSIVPLV